MSRSPEQRWQRAQRYLAQGQVPHARAMLEAMQAQAPRHAWTHVLAAHIAWHEDRIRDATRFALDAARVTPDDPAQRCDILEMLLRVGEMVAARGFLGRPSLIQASSPQWLIREADFRQQLCEYGESLALVERAMAAGADTADVHFQYAVLLYFHGRLDEAGIGLRACLRREPTHGRAALILARLRRQTAAGNCLEEIVQGLREVEKGSRDDAALEFAHYKTLEDLGRFSEAWDALARGNRMMHLRNPYDAAGHRAYLQRLIEVCTRDGLRPAAIAGEAPQPIFIIGLARSGTTVLERLLGNHSQIQAAGELTDFGNQLHWTGDTCITQSEAFLARLNDFDFAELGRRYLAQTQWRAHGRRFYIDKQPPNWVVAGFIRAALPQAKILHLVRDPMDACFSNFRVFFGDTYVYSYDQRGMATYHRDYRRVMAHWHAIMPDAILDVSYADLVRKPEAAMRRVLDFCGIAWESACADLGANQASVGTLSAAQVRQPIHARAFEQWRPYAGQLAPMLEALQQA